MPVVTVQSVEQFDRLLQVQDKTQDDAHGKSYLVVDFKAVWCGPCKRLAPIFEQLSDNQEYNKHFLFCTADVDVVEELATRYYIQKLPTIIFLEVGADNFTPEGKLKHDPIEGGNSNIESDLKNRIGYLSSLVDDGDSSDGSNF